MAANTFKSISVMVSPLLKFISHSVLQLGDREGGRGREDEEEERRWSGGEEILRGR